MSGDATVGKAAHSLTNRGLIDGRDTQVNAGTPGGPAGTVNNDSETIGGATSAVTLAARERLDLGVLNNREHSLVFSAGNLFLVGALDASH